MSEPFLDLDPGRWPAITPYLERALDLDGEGRSTWLNELRAEKPHVADLVERLLRDHRELLRRDAGGEGDAGRQELADTAVGGYRLLELIGEGGMGTVWLAERADGRFQSRAAIKLLKLALLGSSAEARFRREGEVLARLAHPGVARLLDAGVAGGGQPYLVLEYVDGQPIDAYCDGHTLGIEARLRLFLDVLAAVEHAHASLVVHRDIKPSNVLCDTYGQVKLLDFGIAKLMDGGGAQLLTREGAALLTPAFAAPEQVTGGPVTTATDVYALGVLAHVLLTGRHPAGAEPSSPADLITSIVDREPLRMSEAVAVSAPDAADLAGRRASDPRRLRRALRGDLDLIVAKALEKRPGMRYASAEAFAEDVRRHLGRRPIGARPHGVVYRARTFVRRHARAATAGAAAIVLLAALITFYTVRLAEQRDRARLDAEKAALVSGLLTDLLTGIEPSVAQSDQSVRELLDAGAARASTELADRPDVLAELLTVIGRVYQRLDRHERAQPLLERALALGRDAGGPDHPRVSQTLNDLGVLLRARRELDAAAAMLEEALAIRRRLLGPKHADIAVSASELSRVLDDLGRSERAEALAREALAMRRGLFGEEHRETATTMGDLGLLRWKSGDLHGAEALLRRSLEISQRVLGPEHPNVTTTLANLGLIVGDLGDHAGSERLFRQSLAVERKTLGPQHPSVAGTLNNLAWALREQGRFDEAVAAQSEAVKSTVQASGEDSPRAAHFRSNLARVHLASGNPGKAEPLLRQALSTRARTYGPDDWRVGMTKSLLGAALTALGRYDEAEALLLDARRILRDGPGQEGQEARETASRIDALYRTWLPRRPESISRRTPGD